MIDSRRAIAVALALGLLFGPIYTRVHSAERPVKIGVLSPYSREMSETVWTSFRSGLRDLGWEEGRNIFIEFRFGDGKLERLARLAEELLKLNVNLIVAQSTPAARAAIAATKTVPIVFVEVGDPVATGIVTNLAHPGGNVTGLMNMARDLAQKRLQILKEVVPSARRIAVIMNPEDPVITSQWREAQAAADQLHVELQPLEMRNADDLRRAFHSAATGKADAVLRLSDPLATVLGVETADLAKKYRLPLMTRSRQEVQFGGLLSYYADARDCLRRAASHVDRVLRGAQPGYVPVEQPTKFELVINLKTARAIGLAIPQSLLLRADYVIE